MSNLDVLKTLVTQMLSRPINVKGFTQIYPTPVEIFGDSKIKWNQPHVTIAFNPDNIEELYSGKGSLKVYACMLQTPQDCAICGEKATQVAVIEGRGPAIKGYKNVRIYSPDYNVDKLWEAIQRNRYWLTIPVCGQHKPDVINESVSLVMDNEEKLFSLQVTNKTWANRFIQLNRSQVRFAAYKDKSFLEKRRIGTIMAMAGGFTSMISIGAAFQGAWFWLIPTLLVLGIGLYLIFSKQSETLVTYKTKPGEKKQYFLSGVITFGSVLVTAGIMTLVAKINGELLLSSIPIGVKWLVIAIGSVIAFVGAALEAKVKKQNQ